MASLREFVRPVAAAAGTCSAAVVAPMMVIERTVGRKVLVVAGTACLWPTAGSLAAVALDQQVRRVSCHLAVRMETRLPVAEAQKASFPAVVRKARMRLAGQMEMKHLQLARMVEG